jgi:hypothetical protein
MSISINIPAQKIPVLAEADIVVIGGGPAGIAAAVSAARHGAKVVLLERWPSVGGQATNALVNIWHTSDRTKQVIRGIVQEVIDRAGSSIERFSDFPAKPETHQFEPGAMRVVFHRLLEDAGVRVICHLPAIQSIVEDGRMRAVLVDTKNGRKAICGKIFIDATGDGDIAANAGLLFDYGRTSDGLVQGMTMMFRLCGINSERVLASPQEADKVFAEMKKLRAEGKFPPFLDMAANSYLHSPRNHIVSYNMCPVSGNPLDEEELTRLSVKARYQVMRYVDFWQQNMPGFEKCELEQMAFWLGIRESRRIRGIKQLNTEMVVNAVKQSDAIGHGFWMIDIHDPKGNGHTTWCDQKVESMPPVGESYHIPLDMCLNTKIPNLAVAGRCASATHEGQASVRIQTHCMVMGQGVGIAAALALESEVYMNQIDIKSLQSILKTDGVYIEDIPDSPKNSNNH